ncbi:MAG TPA: MgtC/SapB family protein [Bacillota bacterium]|jgi:putative Mg2+ transporter-C (MgtC) family protein
MTFWDMVLRVAAALTLGGLIGLERQSTRRPAGLRTHILVCVGSSLIMMVSIGIYDSFRSATVDPGRIAAQVVSGIGFLGAGTILREGATVRGLTTAASLWVVSGVGLATGAGLYAPAVVTTAVALLALVVLGRAEHTYLAGKDIHGFVLRMSDEPGMIGRIGSLLGVHGVDIRNINMHEIDNHQVEVEFQVRLGPRISAERLVDELFTIPGVHSVDHSD